MNWPLMHGNISKSDLDCVKNLFDQDNPKLTQGPKVKQFEQSGLSGLVLSTASLLIRSSAIC